MGLGVIDTGAVVHVVVFLLFVVAVLVFVVVRLVVRLVGGVDVDVGDVVCCCSCRCG